MSNINISYNAGKNGIELRFDSKPSSEVLNVLKLSGFRWSNRQKMWYARQNEQTVGVANSLSEGEALSLENKNKSTNNSYNLWAMTRTDDIGNHIDKAKGAKEIAAEVRKHVKPRFPMCNISIRSDYNSIDIDVKASPFDKGSDELKAICEYITAYVLSYKYCTDFDPYGDYGSSYNFYFHKCDVYYDYKQTDMTVAVAGMCEDFQQKKQAFEVAEAERQEREFQERMERDRIEREEAARIQKFNDEKRDQIQSCVDELSVEYFVENLVDYGYSKRNSTDEYKESKDEEEERSARVCKVTKEVHMNKEQYAFFENHFLMDWSFVAGMGGSNTDDLRIASMMDYEMMSAEERETVEWYDTNCVAVYCDGKPMCVIDPQGYDYCRYVYFFGDETRIEKGHETRQAITKEEREEDVGCAEYLIDVSTNVIESNDLIDRWDTDGFEVYKAAMKEWIYNHNTRFDAAVIRAISGEHERLKAAMYKLLREINGVQEQFKRAGLKNGEQITIVKISEFGGINVTRATFDSFTCTKYAQYDDAVKLVIKPIRKRNYYYMYIYSDLMIYSGWLGDVPEDLLWDISDNGRGVITKMSRYRSFDDEQYKVIFEYYKKLGALPVIDTRSHGRYVKR